MGARGMSYYILANDGISNEAKQTLESLNFTVDTNHYTLEELHQKIQEVDVVIVRSATKIRSELIDSACLKNRCKLIIRAGVGIDNIDHEYAKAKGIQVRNTPNSSSDAVAELAIGHMFAIARHIYISNVTMRQGQWNKKQYTGFELSGKTLGLVGFGRIAQSVAKKAIALGMNVIYDDILGQSRFLPECTFVGKDQLLQKADIISLHIPYNPKFGPYISEKECSNMKKGMVLINTARGGTVSEKALLDALNNGTVSYVALDVFEDEPTKNKDIYTHDRISLTPHVGASTLEAQHRIGQEIVEVIKEELL